jgi:hypothetical protein
MIINNESMFLGEKKKLEGVNCRIRLSFTHFRYSKALRVTAPPPIEGKF